MSAAIGPPENDEGRAPQGDPASVVSGHHTTNTVDVTYPSRHAYRARQGDE